MSASFCACYRTTRGATCNATLRTYSYIGYPMVKAACAARGMLRDDAERSAAIRDPIATA